MAKNSVSLISVREKPAERRVAENGRGANRDHGLQEAIGSSTRLLDAAKKGRGKTVAEKDQAEAASEKPPPQHASAVAKMGQLAMGKKWTVVIKVYMSNCKYGKEVVSFLGMNRNSKLFLAYSKGADPTDLQRKYISCTAQL